MKKKLWKVRFHVDINMPVAAHSEHDAVNVARLYYKEEISRAKTGFETTEVVDSIPKEFIGSIPWGLDDDEEMTCEELLAQNIRSDLERYRDALEHIAKGNIAPSIEFARNILDGLDVDKAHKKASK